MKAVLSGKKHESMPTVDAWLKHSNAALQMIPSHGEHSHAGNSQEGHDLALLRGLTRANVITQLSHLQTHPFIASAMTRGKLKLYGWVYEIHTGQIESFDAEQGRFLPLSPETPTSVAQPRLHLMAS